MSSRFLGSGLSSSASVEVLTGYILRDFFGFDVTNQDLALIGQYAENTFNKVNCLVQISQAVYLYHLLQLRQGRLALAAALIVLGVPKAPLLVAAGDDDV